MAYDHRHGGPYDRGQADSYYGRPRTPHCYRGAPYGSERVTYLTGDDLAAYHAGYDDNERNGDKKDWGTR